MKHLLIVISIVLFGSAMMLCISCGPKSSIPFFAEMGINPDTLLSDSVFTTDYSNVDGFELDSVQTSKITKLPPRDKSKIVSIRQYGDNYFVILYDDLTLNAYLLSPDGKQLDYVYLGVHHVDNNEYFLFNASDTIRLTKPTKCETQFLPGGKFKTLVIPYENDTISWAYSILGNKINFIGRTATRVINTQSIDMAFMPLSQMDEMFEMLGRYHFIGDAHSSNCSTVPSDCAPGQVFTPLLYNPTGVFQWIYDHRGKEKVSENLYFFYRSYCYAENRVITYEYMKAAIMAIKNKKAQQYLLTQPIYDGYKFAELKDLEKK